MPGGVPSIDDGKSAVVSGGRDAAAAAGGDRTETARVEDQDRQARRPPPWLGRALWALVMVAILGPLLVFPVTLGAGDDVGDDVRLPAILRSFDRTLAATGWGDAARVFVWGVAGLALLAAFALLWVAFASEE